MSLSAGTAHSTTQAVASSSAHAAVPSVVARAVDGSYIYTQIYATFPAYE